MRFLFRAKRGEKIFESLTVSCAGGARNTRDAQAELAHRDGLALLFLVEEGRGTHANPEVGWRVEVGWPYYPPRPLASGRVEPPVSKKQTKSRF